MCFPVHHGPGCYGPSDIMCSPGGFRAVTGGPSIFGCGYPSPMMGYHHGYHGFGHDHCPIGRENKAIAAGGILGGAVGVAAGVSLCKTGALLGSVGGPIGALVGGVAGLALGALAGKAFARS